MNDEIMEEMKQELYVALSASATAQETAALLLDLCTYKEVENMAQRLRAARLLHEGKTYAQVTEATEISSATLSRVSRCLQYGAGGYATILKKIGY